MIRVDGIARVVARIDGLRASRGTASAMAGACADHVERVLVNDFLRGQAIGVRSGTLSNPGNWTVRRYETPQPGATLFTSVPYARIQNYGLAGRLRPRLFLEQAVDAALPQFKQIMRDTWSERHGF